MQDAMKLAVMSTVLSAVGFTIALINLIDDSRHELSFDKKPETIVTSTEAIVTSTTEETTTSTTIAEESVTTETSIATEAVTESVIFETQPVVTAAPVVDIPVESTETVVVAPTGEFIGTFTRGTYYTFGTYGGSGRTLVSGYSIASRALYEMYGYGDYKIRIECDEFPELNGIYSLDDCSAKGDNRVIDFWFSPGEVPAYFKQMGVLEVRAYIVR